MRIFTVLSVFLLLLSPSLALSDEITLWLMAGECLPERAYSGKISVCRYRYRTGSKEVYACSDGEQGDSPGY